MKILIIDFAASEGGAITILRQYHKLAVKDTNNDYVFLLSDNYCEETKNVRIEILKNEKRWLRRLVFDYFTGKNLVKKINPDKIISLQNTIVHGVRVPQTLYVHQSLPFQTIKRFSFFRKSERKFAIIQRLIGHEIKKSVRKADGVIVQTKWMKKAVVRECGISPRKVIIEAPTINIEIKKTHRAKKRNHFFYPTSDYIYKNNDIVIDAAKILEDEGYNNFVIELTIEGESTKHIKKIGRITHEEVMKKYQDSTLLFPSYIETFGLPLLEARVSGSEIIAANTEFAKEILHNYPNVQFFDYNSASELAGKIRNILRKNDNK